MNRLVSDGHIQKNATGIPSFTRRGLAITPPLRQKTQALSNRAKIIGLTPFLGIGKKPGILRIRDENSLKIGGNCRGKVEVVFNDSEELDAVFALNFVNEREEGEQLHHLQGKGFTVFAFVLERSHRDPLISSDVEYFDEFVLAGPPLVNSGS